VLIGNLHEKVLDVIRERGLVKDYTEPYFKFLFRSEPLTTSVGAGWELFSYSRPTPEIIFM
jgi:hypothetical protein